VSIDPGVVLVAAAGLFAVLIAVLPSLIAGEIRAWLPHLARRLVCSAALRLPPSARDRYRKEWLAELAAWEDRPLSALAKAAHLRWNANVVRESISGVSMKGDRLKRLVDLGGAASLIAVMAPVLVAIAIAVKLESKGPIVFRQQRAGRDNVHFPLLKFRTMYIDAEERILSALNEGGYKDHGELVHALGYDPGVTRVGRFLRRSSLDELPQLFNVMRGEMSLVGPRPLHASEADHFARAPLLDEEAEEQRASVRPGLTGSSRVVFHHRLGGFREMLRLDAEYARSRSLLEDIRLLLLTPLHLFRPPKRRR
jgi:lipopolysaccharide/colanic/teichoic acid biosynthesis glycosyltransferase